MASRQTLGPLASWVARLKTDEQAARRLTDAVAESFAAEDIAVSLFDAGGSGPWQVAIHFRAAPDKESVRTVVAAAAAPAGVAALKFARVKTTDWVRESLTGLDPVVAGRFVVYGAHDRALIPVNRIGIEIEAALAFGTGHHGTTRGCLLALDRLCKSLRKSRAAAFPCKAEGHGRILDLGTGSGVLAIAAARALRRRVLATEVDASAVRVARANARLNRVVAMVEVVRADGITARSVRDNAPFDLVFANILLGPLQRLAAPLKELMTPGGRIVASGLLPAQANAAIAAYRPLALERRIDLDGWTTLVLARRTKRRMPV